MTPRMSPARLLALPLAVLVAGVLTLVVAPRSAEAQVPATDEQALAIERQLLCPVCTNERLDVCTTAICNDMKRIIRDRLAAGANPDDIILYFETRYGPKVRAELPAEGFNLWLYGWIAASLLLVGGGGAWFLARLRATPATAAHAPPPPEEAADDAWLDEQLDPTEGSRTERDS